MSSKYKFNYNYNYIYNKKVGKYLCEILLEDNESADINKSKATETFNNDNNNQKENLNNKNNENFESYFSKSIYFNSLL